MDNSAKTCRCGKCGAKKRKGDGRLKSFCVQVPGERWVSCPCFLARQRCNHCNCYNCGNYYGKQVNSEHKHHSKVQIHRKREQQFIPRNTVHSLDLIAQRNVEVATNTSWSEFETLLFEVILNTVRNKANYGMQLDEVSGLTTTFNMLCNIINHNLLPLPVNSKPKKQVQGKITHLRQQTILFREVYMRQVKFNLKFNI